MSMDIYVALYNVSCANGSHRVVVAFRGDTSYEVRNNFSSIRYLENNNFVEIDKMIIDNKTIMDNYTLKADRWNYTNNVVYSWLDIYQNLKKERESEYIVL